MKRPRPLFIVGCFRSGTTLLRKVLNTFPGIYISKETGFITDVHERFNAAKAGAGLEAFFDYLNSYMAIEKWDKRASVDGFREFCLRSNDDTYSGLVNYIWQLESPQPYEGLSYIGDNTPKYIMAIPFLESVFKDACYIHIVRDPRDVVASVVKQRFGANTPLLAAREWMERVSCWLMAERVVPPSRRCEIHYEDLAADPDPSVKKILSFLGMEDEFVSLKGKELGPCAVSSSHKHHSRLKEAIDTKSIGRYKKDLSAQDIETIESVTYPGLKAFGYACSVFRPSPIMNEKNLLITRDHINDLLARARRSILRR